MDAKNAHSDKVEFNSLKEIMERFKAVSYDQFQQELNDWFYGNLSKSQDESGLQILENSGLGDLPALVSEIYHRAEILNALSEANIRTGNEEK